jgi:hypothetical protein
MSAAEPVTLSKFVGGFVSATGWVKAAAIGIRILALVLVLGIPAGCWFFGHKAGYSEAKDKFYKAGYADASDWFAKHPVQSFGDGCTVNNNVSEKDKGFKACVWPLTFGWR